MDFETTSRSYSLHKRARLNTEEISTTVVQRVSRSKSQISKYEILRGDLNERVIQDCWSSQSSRCGRRPLYAGCKQKVLGLRHCRMRIPRRNVQYVPRCVLF